MKRMHNNHESVLSAFLIVSQSANYLPIKWQKQEYLDNSAAPPICGRQFPQHFLNVPEISLKACHFDCTYPNIFWVQQTEGGAYESQQP